MTRIPAVSPSALSRRMSAAPVSPARIRPVESTMATPGALDRQRTRWRRSAQSTQVRPPAQSSPFTRTRIVVPTWRSAWPGSSRTAAQTPSGPLTTRQSLPGAAPTSRSQTIGWGRNMKTSSMSSPETIAQRASAGERRLTPLRAARSGAAGASRTRWASAPSDSSDPDSRGGVRHWRSGRHR